MKFFTVRKPNERSLTSSTGDAGMPPERCTKGNRRYAPEPKRSSRPFRDGSYRLHDPVPFLTCPQRSCWDQSCSFPVGFADTTSERPVARDIVARLCQRRTCKECEPCRLKVNDLGRHSGFSNGLPAVVRAVRALLLLGGRLRPLRRPTLPSKTVNAVACVEVPAERSAAFYE